MKHHLFPRAVHRSALLLLPLAAALALVSCGDNPTQVTAPKSSPAFAIVSDLTQVPVAEMIFVCKDGPAGTYDYSATITSGNILQANGVDPVLLQDTDKDGDSTFSVDAGVCLQIALGGGPDKVIEVTELAHSGTHFVSTTLKAISGTTVTTTTEGNPVSIHMAGTPHVGGVAIFTNASDPSLSISKTADAATVQAGSNIGFGITVNSDGPGDATAVTLNDNLPTGTGISWSIDTQPAQGTCSIVSNVLSCNFGNMAMGTSVTVHITSPTTAQSCGQYDNTATASTANFGDVSGSASITVQCAGTGGCTPGFWKQSQHFQFWTSPYTTGSLIKNVFSNTAGYNTDKTNKPIGDQTLLQGLSFQGGNSIGGAAETLLRAGIAGVLSAANSSVNYGQTPADVINAVSTALASHDRTTILGVASAIDLNNNRQCTLP